MITILVSALKIIFLLGFIILIHECGHFFIAKLCKVKVTDFAIGFGPTLFKKQGKETKYAIRAIPLGGYVNMVGEEERSDEEGSFSKASIGKRIAIILAGATVNIIFGLLVYFILITASGNNISNVVEEIQPAYGAETAGIEAGDKILKVDGKNLRIRSDLEDIMSKSEGKELTVTIERNNETKEIKLTPTKKEERSLGVALGTMKDKKETEVLGVYQGKPAEVAGMERGDIIQSIDGKDEGGNTEGVIKNINSSTGEKIEVVVDRKGEILTFEIEPQKTDVYYLGVIFKIADKSITNNIYYGFWETVDFSVSILDNLREIFGGKISTDQLMGPVGISGEITRTEGAKEFIFMVALISLSLGVTNLLPFPPLDGGKIVFLIIEAIRRKPLKESVEIGIQTAGFALLIGLSIYVTYKDILRIF